MRRERTRAAPILACLFGLTLGACANSQTPLRVDVVEPNTGPVQGGGRVILRGVGFKDGLAIRFGEAAAVDVEVVSSVYATATVPPGAAGPVDVVPLRPGRRATGFATYTYLASPVIERVDPARGPAEGGTMVAIVGSGFPSDAILLFGETPAVDVTVLDESTIQARTPAHPPGVVDVVVRRPGGGEGRASAAFRFVGEDGAFPCRLVAATPALAATDVDVVGTFSFRWDTALIDGFGRVELEELGRGPVPIDVVFEGDGLRVTPERSLHFWSSYLLSARGVSSVAGECEEGAVAFSTMTPETEVPDLRPASIQSVAVVGDHAIGASDGLRGLQVYALAPDGDAELVAEYRTSWSPQGVAWDGDWLFVAAAHDGVFILSASDLPALREVGRIGTPGDAVEVVPFRRGDRRYVAIADGPEGARIVDVTDVGAPVDVSVIDPSDEPGQTTDGVDVAGDRLAMSEGRLGYRLVDISDPFEPSVLASGSIGRVARDVALGDGVLFVAHGPSGIHAFDLSPLDLRNPIDVGFGTRGRCPSNCTDVFLSVDARGREVFASARRGGAVRLRLEGSTLEMVGAWPTGGAARDARVHEDRVYIAEEGGLRIVEPGASPELRFFDEGGHGVARDLVGRDGLLYVAASSRGLQTFALGDRDRPRQIDRDDTPGVRSVRFDRMARSLALFDEGGVLVADSRAGLARFDASDSRNPTLDGALDAEDQMNRVVVDGRRAVVCDDNFGFHVVDTESMSIRSTIEWRAIDPEGDRDLCHDVLVDEGYLYVGSRERLTVFELGEGTEPPRWVSAQTAAPDTSYTSLELIEGRLFATTATESFEAVRGSSDTRVRVFDLSDHGRPLEVFVSDDIGGAASLTATGDILFVPGGDAGIHVFDISDPTVPVHQGTIPTPGDTRAAAVVDGVLYAVHGEGGLSSVRTGALP